MTPLNSSAFNNLQAIGLNPFAVQLLAESVLKSPIAPLTVGKPQRFALPVNRADCAGWAGVRFTVEAVREADRNAPWPEFPSFALVSQDKHAELLNKVATVLMAKLGTDSLTVTKDDAASIREPGFLAVDFTPDGLHVRLIQGNQAAAAIAALLGD